jgi:hypothetical protein
LKHSATPKFWRLLRGLPKPVRDLAKKNFQLLKANPRHPSLHFKKIGDLYSARVGIVHRALAVEGPEGPVWFEWKDPAGLRGCGFFWIKDGKIAFQRGYWDKLTFLRLQGLPVPKA